MKAAELLHAINTWSKTPEQLLRELPDEQFRIACYAAAEMLKTFKDEAVRRGIWDDIKTKKVK